MSRPVPSPSMKGMIGRSGTRYFPLAYSIRWPSTGTGTPLNAAMMNASAGKGIVNYKEHRQTKNARWRDPALRALNGDGRYHYVLVRLVLAAACHLRDLFHHVLAFHHFA